MMIAGPVLKAQVPLSRRPMAGARDQPAAAGCPKGGARQAALATQAARKRGAAVPQYDTVQYRPQPTTMV